jgi:hypothetical protein
MNRLASWLLIACILVGSVVLSGCATDYSAIYQNANHTVQRLAVGPIGEYDSKTVPHALGGPGPNFGKTASQYRWAHVQGITKVDRDTWLHTVAHVPDQIPQLNLGDIVDVLFPTLSDSNFDDFHTAIVLRVVCKNDAIANACRQKLYQDAGKSRYYRGPTGDPIPDTDNLVFSKYYDEDGRLLPGVKLPQDGAPSVANYLLQYLGL